MAQSTQNAEKDIEALKADLAALRKDFSALSGHMRDAAESGAEGLSAEARQRMHRLRSEFDDLAGHLGQRGRHSIDSVERQIEERPLTAMLVAFLVGLVLGKLFDR